MHCFQRNGVIYYYLGGFEPSLARFGPGAALIDHAIGAAIDEGARAFDFMRGAEPYKARWGAATQANARMIFGRAGLASRVAVSLMRLERELARRVRRGSDAGAAPAPVAT
jgi:CelD/BcsL family acetyltransferase involved in cellulose biosynthesis